MMLQLWLKRHKNMPRVCVCLLGKTPTQHIKDNWVIFHMFAERLRLFHRFTQKNPSKFTSSAAIICWVISAVLIRDLSMLIAIYDCWLCLQAVRHIYGDLYEVVDYPARGFAFQLHGLTVNSMARYSDVTCSRPTYWDVLTQITHICQLISH